jgi:hypothetical protein
MTISGDKKSPLKVFLSPLLLNSGDMPPLMWSLQTLRR